MKKHLIFILSLILATNLFSIDFNKNIIGYFTSWSVYGRNFHVPDIQADKINYINYAFANINSQDGTIKLGDPYADIDKWYDGDSWDPGSLRGNFHRLQILKEQNPHIKTIISIGGWTWSTYFSDIALTAESRSTFAASCVQFIQEYGFDGIDIDWEYPVEGGLPSNIHRPEDKENFTLLLGELRQQLDNAGNYLLTIAAPADPSKMANIELDLIHPYLDWINLMTYDFHGPWGDPEADPFTHFNTPFNIIANDGWQEPYHSNYNFSATIQNYLNAGVPPEKLNAGLAFYGRGYANVPNQNNGLFQTYSGPAGLGSWENGVFDYWDLDQNYVGINGYEYFWNEEAQVPWLYNPSSQIMISYDNPASIEVKCNYINSCNIGGAMFWEFSCDKYGTLLETTYNSLNDSTQTHMDGNVTEALSKLKSTNFPNPFNPSTTISYELPNVSKVKIDIYNIRGELIKNLYNGTKNKDKHSIIWKGNNNSGKNVPSGIYFYRIKSGKYTSTKKIILLK
jgi:chitinase